MFSFKWLRCCFCDDRDEESETWSTDVQADESVADFNQEDSMSQAKSDTDQIKAGGSMKSKSASGVRDAEERSTSLTRQLKWSDRHRQLKQAIFGKGEETAKKWLNFAYDLWIMY